MFDEQYSSLITETVFSEGLKLKRSGTKFVGIYCAFTPQELIAAAGAVPVTLCAGSQEPITEGEKHLPRNLCPLIKASYGHALLDSCPYFHFVDFLFADSTCDGKKKMFELLGSIKPVHVLNLPQTYQTETSVLAWCQELQRMKEILERETGQIITDQSIRDQIKLYNKYRKTIKQVFELNTGEVPLLYGREIRAITDGGGFDCNIQERITEMETAILMAKERANNAEFIDKMRPKPRILLTGCPSTNNKLLYLIENSGGIVVAMENCGGLKTVGSLVDEEEPMRDLAEYYVRTACPCMTPNPRRLDIISDIISNYKIDGVVELIWHACHTYNVESYLIKKHVKSECHKPYLYIETDYTQNDIEQLRLRVQAFLELM